MNKFKMIVGYGFLSLSCAIVVFVTDKNIDTNGLVGLVPLLAFWGGSIIHSMIQEESIK